MQQLTKKLLCSIFYISLLYTTTAQVNTLKDDLIKADESFIKENYFEAITFYKKNVSELSAQQLSNLGKALMEFRSNEKDYEEAVKLFRKASDLGALDAEMGLALAYIQGAGVKEDLQLGLKLIQELAFKQHPEALYTLGTFYQNGENSLAIKKITAWRHFLTV